MAPFSRGEAILALSICRNLNWRQWQSVESVGARGLPRTRQFSQGRRSIHGVKAELQLECGDGQHEQRLPLRVPVEVVLMEVRRPSSRPLTNIYPARTVCIYGDLNCQDVGFRVLCQGEECVSRASKISGRDILIVGQVTESKSGSLGFDMDQTTVFPDCGTAKFSVDRVQARPKEIMERRCGPNFLDVENVMDMSVKIADGEVEPSAEYDLVESVKLTEREGMVDAVISGTVYESCVARGFSNFNKPTIAEDATPAGQIGSVHSNAVNLPPDNLPRSPSVGEGESQYPVPLSPLSGELARVIEYERAMVAEAAVKSGPAITRSGVLFEDEWLMVINKPCGMYCEHVLATLPSLLNPAADFSSLSRLTLHRPVGNKDNYVPHLHMANRLDRDTSGVMVITKCRNAAGKLSNIFTNRKAKKSYIALCRGPRPSWKSLTVVSGHGRSRYGAWRVYSKRDVGSGLPGGSVVRDMTTHLVVLAINKQSALDDQLVGRSTFDNLNNMQCLVTAEDESSRNVSGHSRFEKLDPHLKESSNDDPLSTKDDEVVVCAFPLTGRTHQIRLHCQFVGLPLRGDVKYGGPHFLNGVRYDHHALHAETLSFRHPFTFEELRFVAPLPQWAIDAGVQPLVL